MTPLDMSTLFTVDRASKKQLGAPGGQEIATSHRSQLTCSGRQQEDGEAHGRMVAASQRRDMQLLRTLFLAVCLSLAVSPGSCRCKLMGGVPPADGAEVDLLEEEEEEEEEEARARMESLLGSVRQELLRRLNLSAVPQEHSRVQPPPFMLELYNRYAADASSAPRSDVVRSFGLLEVTRSENHGNGSWHRLLFNISIPCREEVTRAELRLFTVRRRVPGACRGRRVNVSVYSIESSHSESALRLLGNRSVNAPQRSWEVFDVTGAGWQRIATGQNLREFEVHIEHGECAALDLSLSLRDNSSAFLIVFSDDLRSKRKETWNDLTPSGAHKERRTLEPAALSDDNEIPADGHPRRKRQARSDYCRRTSLRVKFKDIGWDSWIIAPPEYDAFECRGTCYFPLTDDMSPSKHALIQTLVNLGDPKKANMPCCVPTKLDPITVLFNENGILTMKHFYEEMKVAECGCR